MVYFSLFLKSYVTFSAKTEKKCAKDLANFDYCSNVYFTSAAVFQKVKERISKEKSARNSGK
jgi:hypothetical protein